MNWATEDRMPAIRGELVYDIYRGGELVEHVEDHNLVVNRGRLRLAQLVCGDSTVAIKYIGFGTGRGIATLNDDSLTNQRLFELKSHTVTAQQVTFNWELGVNDANGLEIGEFGLFTADQIMFTHQVRNTTFGKESDVQMRGTYTLYF